MSAQSKTVYVPHRSTQLTHVGISKIHFALTQDTGGAKIRERTSLQPEPTDEAAKALVHFTQSLLRLLCFPIYNPNSNSTLAGGILVAVAS